MSIQTARTVTDYDGVVRALDRGESVELTSSSAYSGRKVVAEERVAALEAALATATEWSEEDQALPEDSEIKAARPSFTGNHRRRAEAQRMVSAKRSKAALIDLVNWLLAERDRVSEEATEAAEAARAQLAAAVEALTFYSDLAPGDEGRRIFVGHVAREALAKLRAAKEGPPMFAPCLACGERHGQFISCDRARQEKR